MVEEKIVKIDEANVAIIKEARAIHNKTNLEAQKTNMIERIAEIDKLLAVFTA